MEKNLEIEYKTLLSPFHFNLLKDKYFNEAILLVQENHYYDTENRDLMKAHASARLRFVNNKVLFTLKQLTPDNHVLEHEVEDDELKIYDPRIKQLLISLGINPHLICISKSLTYRYLIKDEFGEWCLDRNEFNNYCDFELEYELIESIDNQRERFMSFLNDIKCDYLLGDSKFIRSLK